MNIHFFKSDKGVTAYKQTQTDSPIGVFFLSGHRADFDNENRIRLEAICAKLELSYTHFTHYGWEQSVSPAIPERGESYVHKWLQQAFDLFDNVTSGSHIVVGSSMGVYMGLAFAQARPERIKGLVGLAPGFGPTSLKTMSERYGDYSVATETEEGFSFIVKDDVSLPITETLQIDCPIRLRHAMSDTVASYKNTEHIAKAVTSNDVVLCLTKDGSHDLDRPSDTAWLEYTLAELTNHSGP